VRRRSRLGRQLEADLAGTYVRVLHLAVLELHVRAELVPRNGALRRAVDLLEQRLDLTLLTHSQLEVGMRTKFASNLTLKFIILKRK